MWCYVKTISSDLLVQSSWINWTLNSTVLVSKWTVHWTPFLKVVLSCPVWAWHLVEIFLNVPRNLQDQVLLGLPAPGFIVWLYMAIRVPISSKSGHILHCAVWQFCKNPFFLLSAGKRRVKNRPLLLCCFDRLAFDSKKRKQKDW